MEIDTGLAVSAVAAAAGAVGTGISVWAVMRRSVAEAASKRTEFDGRLNTLESRVTAVESDHEGLDEKIIVRLDKMSSGIGSMKTSIAEISTRMSMNRKLDDERHERMGRDIEVLHNRIDRIKQREES